MLLVWEYISVDHQIRCPGEQNFNVAAVPIYTITGEFVEEAGGVVVLAFYQCVPDLNPN